MEGLETQNIGKCSAISHTNTDYGNQVNYSSNILPCGILVPDKVPQYKYVCDICKTHYTNKRNLEEHFLSNKHKENAMHGGVVIKKFECKICDIVFDNNKQLQKHLLTLKHKNKLNPPTKTVKKKQNKTKHFCKNCNKEYTTYSGMWKHQQKCEIIEQEDEDYSNKQIQKKQTDGLFTPEFMMLLVKEMKNMMIEQQKVMMEQNKNMTGAMLEQNKNITTAIGEMAGSMTEIAKNVGTHTNTNNSNNTINDNKSFNLNFFLNERCKNAMNLSDFVNGVDISLDDFEETGRIGYVEGLSRIFCKELQKLDIYERPIHCSDAKRETFYVRENNKWEKDENKEMLLSAVKKVGKKNLKVLALWQEKHPGHKDVESKENDRYLRILTNVLCCGDSDEETLANYGKIIKNISLVTVVDKNQERLK
jgi:hypothetical protein